MNTPRGPIKYVIIKGKATSILLIYNFCESLTIHPPTNKFIDTKCIQNKIRNKLFENKLDKFDILK